MSANYKMVALQVGDLIKYNITEKSINICARSTFNFNVRNIDITNDITSVRAKTFANWILCLALENMPLEEKNKKLLFFLDSLLKGQYEDEVDKILIRANVKIEATDFNNRNYHYLIIKHSKKLYQECNYFHAVFEAAKVYNKHVQLKSKSTRDGQDLMLNVLSINGCIKLNAGLTKTEQNIQEGVKFLSAGLMQAMRNPTSHEPALDWPIKKQDCLDMLSFISYLFRQIDGVK